MSDDLKPAMRGEGDGGAQRRNENQESVPEGNAAGVFDRFNPGAVPPDHDGGVNEDGDMPELTTPSPSIEAEPGQDPQAPNRKGLG